MKFQGPPNLRLRIAIPQPNERQFIKFDENGILETRNPFTIRRLKKRGYQPVSAQADVVPEPTATPDDGPKYRCKKCDFVTDNKGELLAHHRKEHPKGE